jgi:hypothetical protein
MSTCVLSMHSHLVASVTCWLRYLTRNVTSAMDAPGRSSGTRCIRESKTLIREGGVPGNHVMGSNGWNQALAFELWVSSCHSQPLPGRTTSSRVCTCFSLGVHRSLLVAFSTATQMCCESKWNERGL